ncbi:MAG TPA: PaaI family thioesterase [Candidatus Limnocylindria bacterium]
MSDRPAARTRTVTWEDPAPGLAAAADLSGLEYLRAIFEGRLPSPPMALTLGFRGVSVDEGRAVFSGEPAEFLMNPIGVVHGGFAMTLLDSAMGCAVQSTLPAGAAYTTLETKVNFVGAIRPDTGRVRCEAVIVHRGRQIATAEGRVIAERTGKLLAHGVTTCLLQARSGFAGPSRRAPASGAADGGEARRVQTDRRGDGG